MNKFSKISLLALLMIVIGMSNSFAQNITFVNPKVGDTYRFGRSVTLQWDTINTYRKVFRFDWSGDQQNWTRLPLPRAALTFRDSTSGFRAIGSVNTTMPIIQGSAQIYIRIQDVNDANNFGIVGPINIIQPAPAVVDSLIKGDITNQVTLSNKKIYGLDGVIHVLDGGVLRIEEGTIIKGDNTKTSAIVINRGGKIFAKGTAQRPIIMTSGSPAGSRERGDWGGLLVMGRARINPGAEQAVEGGIADVSTSSIKRGWYGGTDDNDSSGVMQYLRVEFAGIAESPDNELNGITLGGVGRRTIFENVQVSYSGDDAFEWFGGTVNGKYLIAYNTLDDDFDTDFGYSGKNQFGIVKRFNEAADVSNSEAFESDNDGSTSNNTPFTNPIFSNFTLIGPMSDTSWAAWTSGASYDNRWNPRFLAGAQIRRNSRMSLHNSVFMGWPSGIEFQSNATVNALSSSSFEVKNCDFYGIKNNSRFIYAGSSTTFSGVLASVSSFIGNNGHVAINQPGNINNYANFENPFARFKDFNPAPKQAASILNTAKFDVGSNVSDAFFDKVAYRGAMGTNRWDIGWVEYDPINADYKAVAAEPQLPPLRVTAPVTGANLRSGRTFAISWDTLSGSYRRVLRFSYSLDANSTSWTRLPLRGGALSFRDSTSGFRAVGTTNSTVPFIATNSFYIKIEDINSSTFTAIGGPFIVTAPAPAIVDSTLKGDLTTQITLSNQKIYGLDGVVHVLDGGVLRIQEGTIIKGDNTKTSAIVINRGGKIYAKGSADKPIIMTSGAPAGNRERGDWGGLLVMGKARINPGAEQAIEGGIADVSTSSIKRGWYGGTDDTDSSGVMQYLRVEFAGIAESPDNELNGITLGAVGSRTVFDHVQVSYSGDDAFEWFGGTVNGKYLVAYNTLDDDFDTDFGYTGKNQFGIVKRFNDAADVSNSEAFESDNDGSTSDNTPLTAPVFSNFTLVGPMSDTSWARWSAGSSYDNRWNPRFLAGAQIRRNSRMSLFNSVFMGWPAGIEIQSNKTVGALTSNAFSIKNNSFFGIKDNKFVYGGSSTTISGSLLNLVQWVVDNGHVLLNQSGDISAYAGFENPFAKFAQFNPAPKSTSTVLNNAAFTDQASNPFFDKVAYRGAMGQSRWDIGWVEYDPINKDYKAQQPEPTPSFKVITPATNTTLKAGRTFAIGWDTIGTYRRVFNFTYSTDINSNSWTRLPLRGGALTFRDSTSGSRAVGTTNSTAPFISSTNFYIKIEDVNSSTFRAIGGPYTVTAPAPAIVDSTLKGDLTTQITLSNQKIYGLDGVLHVLDGGVLRIQEGTIIKGDNTKTSAIVINRGGKIYAKGTSRLPIVMTSGAPQGNRERGDWGGLLVMGKARVNVGAEQAVEGGLADVSTSPIKRGWYGGTDDADSSGVMQYLRVEFAGIAESPDNELNGITLGGVGNRTVFDHIQVSYSGDDAFEWFGGTVNGKYLVAYNTLDDDFDTDFGYRGKNQFGIVKRFKEFADVSNSEAFESDNDGSTSDNTPLTSPVFSNFTVVGPLSDTSWARWSAGNSYDVRWNPRFLTAAQIRRNSRMSLFNTVITGWPAGIEFQSNKTVGALTSNSFSVKYNSFFGIKDNKFVYAGSSTTFSNSLLNLAQWLVDNGHTALNQAGDITNYNGLENPFGLMAVFNPAAKSNAPFIASASFTDQAADSFFERVAYRGAMGPQRWDTEWTEYDPVNKEYKAQIIGSVEEDARNAMTFELAPTVASNMSVIRYFLPMDSKVSIQFINSTGSLMSSFISNEFQNSGNYEYGINVNDLQSGVYFVNITTDFGSFTRKLVVVR